MSAHLTEEEQIESLKRWWADNGKSTVVGVVLAVSGYLGWGLWQDQQQTQAESASVAYQDLMDSVALEPGQIISEEQQVTAQHLASVLKDEHAGGLYASQAALFLAKLAVERSDLAAAAVELQWVLDQNVDTALSLLTRSRLARVKLAQKDYSAALALAGDDDSTFKATFAEIRGDVLLAQSSENEARAAYQLALNSLAPEQGARRQFVEMKLNDLQPVALNSGDASEVNSRESQNDNDNDNDSDEVAGENI